MPCGCNQVLEPDPNAEFTICDNAGAPAYQERGTTPIPQGASVLTVVFTVPKASQNYSFIELDVENITDPSPFQIDVEVTSRSVAAFTVALTGLTDTPNYYLRWNVYVTSI